MAEHRKDIEIEEQNDEVEIDLGRLIQSMWKSFLKLWWLVLALVIAGAAVFTLYQRIYNEPLYACTATLLLVPVMSPAAATVSIMTVPQQIRCRRPFPYILESSFLPKYSAGTAGNRHL